MEENNNQNNNVEKSKIKIEDILSKIVKIILNVIYVLLAIVALILIYNIIQMSVLKRPYMNIFGYSAFQVKSASMSGTMEIGDIVIVKLTKDVQENDIITYQQQDILVTHRLLQKEGNTIIAKGDANNAQDEPIQQEDVIGKVVYIIKNVEIWKDVFTTPEVYILVIITLVLFGISISIGNKEKSSKNQSK